MRHTLTPPDFFLWGFLKGRVYKEHPTSIDELKANITATICSIDQETLLAVMNNIVAVLEIRITS